MPLSKKSKPGRGRPKTEVVWKSISVRFMEDEKERLERISAGVGRAQAEFIRQATLQMMDNVEKTGRFESVLKTA